MCTRPTILCRAGFLWRTKLRRTRDYKTRRNQYDSTFVTSPRLWRMRKHCIVPVKTAPFRRSCKHCRQYVVVCAGTRRHFFLLIFIVIASALSWFPFRVSVRSKGVSFPVLCRTMLSASRSLDTAGSLCSCRLCAPVATL